MPPLGDGLGDAKALADLELSDRDRLRDEAGFAALAGAGWTAMSEAADAALEEAVSRLAAEFAVEPPIGTRDRRFASIAGPPPVEPRQWESSTAAVMAILMAATVAGQALGTSGTREIGSSSSQTSTDGDQGASMNARMTGRVAGSGSRVTADFTFELSGQVVHRVTGATARLTGRASAHVEIEGCPDANGSVKGKLVLTSGESVTGGQDGSSASWTRDLQGAFDITVDDNASIAGLALDVSAQESVRGGTSSSPTGHELGAEAHWEYDAGPGMTSDLRNRAGTSRGTVTNERNATEMDLTKLFRSAAQSIVTAAFLLGTEAEKFWRGGKCVEVLVDPPGGEVDPDSVTEITAKVRHRFENRELDKPVEASLAGVKAVDPAGERQPAPAEVRFTAGSTTGDVGDVTFRSVSNRGIGERTVRFKVRPTAWKITLEGTTHETFGPIVNDLVVTITTLRITSGDGGSLAGTGQIRVKGTLTAASPAGVCKGPYDQTQDVSVAGTLVGSGENRQLKITMTVAPPTGPKITLTCGRMSAQILPGGPGERYGEALGSFELPAAGGTVSLTREAAIGGVMNVSATGTFVVSPAAK